MNTQSWTSGSALLRQDELDQVRLGHSVLQEGCAAFLCVHLHMSLLPVCWDVHCGRRVFIDLNIKDAHVIDATLKSLLTETWVSAQVPLQHCGSNW